jgi:hypothetical protein
MFNLNKIRAHIKMQELQQLKLSRYLAEEQAQPVPRPQRVKDIERAHRRVTDNITMWNDKLDAVSKAPPRPPERPATGSDDPNKPLIG